MYSIILMRVIGDPLGASMPSHIFSGILGEIHHTERMHGRNKQGD